VNKFIGKRSYKRFSLVMFEAVTYSSPPLVYKYLNVVHAPLPPIAVDQLMQDSVPEAWKDGQTSALALSVAFSAKIGRPVPWSLLRYAIDDAIKARWIELASDSGPWPCEIATASTVTLKQSAATGGAVGPGGGGGVSKPKGVCTSSAALEPAALQDLVDALPDIVNAAAGISLRFQLEISVGKGESLSSSKVEEINTLLGSVSPELRVKG
jgi:hypothetical protein